MKHSVGRYVFGLAAIGSGICALTWHQFDALGDASLRPIFIYVLATIEILGGVAIHWTRTARAGALAGVRFIWHSPCSECRSALSIRWSTTAMETSSNNSHLSQEP